MSAHNAIPVIETERLRLRAHRVEDFDDCLAMWSDPEVTRFIGGKPLSGEDVWARLLRYAGHWQLLGYGYWLVEQKETGLFVGEVGFADFKRQIAPSFEGIPEIGWVLIPWAHGKGYAIEAIRAATAWGDAHFGGKTTGCLINPDNLASIRAAEKGGYKSFCRTFYKEHPAIIFRRNPPQ
jgi:RimJ/RimL family protein N-acetyltransferase